ncbi:MAG TPA: glycosyltransferase [Chitinophagaceae bacterium]|jgi:hypothetical protein|nr:glycosyltransferase [Chitinophagaceae bacterium]
MISIVICSINNLFLEQVKSSISETIGTEYELLVWDNLNEGLGICEVYNKMAKKANYDYLCFIHEDILFETQDWGKKICSVFENNQEVGVIGLAGSKYKSLCYSGWYTGIKDFDCVNITHRIDGIDKKLFGPVNHKNFEDVVCIDGVFICCRTSLWEKNRFDEKNLAGFHFYDIDFSIKAFLISKVIVFYEVDVVHITKGGDFGDKWLKTAFEYHKRVSNILPKSVSKKIPSNVEKRIKKVWLDILKSQKIKLRNRFSWILDQNLIINPYYYYSIVKFFLYRFLRLEKLHNFIRKV